MRKLLIGLTVAFLLSFPVARTGAGRYRYDVGPERKALKAQQKRERKVLKIQQKNQIRSWRGQHLSGGQRAQIKHQMQRDKRALHERQRNELQDLKDRQRLMKESARHVH